MFHVYRVSVTRHGDETGASLQGKFPDQGSAEVYAREQAWKDNMRSSVVWKVVSASGTIVSRFTYQSQALASRMIL